MNLHQQEANFLCLLFDVDEPLNEKCLLRVCVNHLPGDFIKICAKNAKKRTPKWVSAFWYSGRMGLE